MSNSLFTVIYLSISTDMCLQTSIYKTMFVSLSATDFRLGIIAVAVAVVFAVVIVSRLVKWYLN